ncbi:MAG: hypothetical protein R3E77_14255 [Steroidobacteraceae bacterium]
MWKLLRMIVLLGVLLAVSVSTWLTRQRSTEWRQPLWIGVWPVAISADAGIDTYINGLERDDFLALEEFFSREGERYGLRQAAPVHVELYPALEMAPPARDPRDGPLVTAFWSLRLRWYAWRQGGDRPVNVRVFVVYHPAAEEQALPHSVGLQKGLLGVVHAFADHRMTAQNNIVIAHEIMHTVGATDKYDPASSMPLYPDGYAEPEREPLLPQRYAEIMAGRRALSATDAAMPSSLRLVRVGSKTAREINWTGRSQ